jgi:nitroreductase
MNASIEPADPQLHPRFDGELTVSQAVLARKSSRAFAARQIEPEKLSLMIYAARWAASRGNTQPWRWIVVQDPALIAELREGLSPNNQWVARAPTIFVLATNPEADPFKDSRHHYIFDCGQSTAQLLLQGAALGLMSHVIAGWTEGPVKRALAIPEPYRVLVLIACGYVGDASTLDEETRQRDLQPKTRLPASETVFYNRWGAPLPDAR